MSVESKTAIDELCSYVDVFCSEEGATCFVSRVEAMLKEHAKAIETLAWFNAREPYFRALVGAVEDAGVFRDEAQDEWRQLVDWEMENRKP